MASADRSGAEGPNAVAPHVDRAPHLDAKYDEIVAECERSLGSTEGLHWLGQISSGIRDFDVDVLAYPVERPRGRDEEPDHLREECRRLARLLSMFLAEEEQRLEAVRTGRLIRVVIQTNDAAAFCLPVVPNHHLVGFRFDPGRSAPSADRPGGPAVVPFVVEGDLQMIELVRDLREDLGLPGQDPGGHHPASDTRHERATGDSRSPTSTGDRTAALADAARAAVTPGALQWVSQGHGKEVVFTCDHFDHHDAGHFFLLVEVEARRKFYREFAVDAADLLSRINRLVRSAMGGPLERLVLDVEQGAIMLYRISAGDYLMGVTLNQSQVDAADRALSMIVATRS